MGQASRDPHHPVRSRAGSVRVAVAIPTYNEAGNVVQLLQRLAAVLGDIPRLDTRVLVIDDGSPDGTASLVDAHARVSAIRIEVLRRPGKAGLGSAYADGMARLLEDPSVDAVLQMDADGSHPTSAIPDMVTAYRQGADIVVGSRYVAGGATPGWPAYRQAISRGGNAYARRMLGDTLRDYTGGFNLFDADLLRRIDLCSLGCAGYGFLIELKHRALALGGGVREIPITFLDRSVGTSKIPRDTVLRNAVLVRRLSRQPHRQRPELVPAVPVVP